MSAKLIEGDFPDVLRVGIPRHVWREVSRACGANPKKMEQFLVDAVEEKMAAVVVGGDDGDAA